MGTTVFAILAVVFGLLTVSAAVGLAEYAAKAVAGRRAEGEVVRLERDGRPSADAVVVRFEAGGQPVEVRNFSFLVGHAAKMIVTGKTSYPVERTLLTTGMLAALVDSKADGHRRVETPELAITY